MSFLKGKRTYLVAAVIFVVGGLKALGVEVPQSVIDMLGGLGLMTLRAAVR